MEVLTNEQKIALIREGRYSVDEFLKENEKLIYSVISIYESKNQMLRSIKDDLVSQGMLGLWKAVNDFDETRGFLFSTLAWKYINNEVYVAVREFSNYNNRSICKIFGEEIQEPVSKRTETIHELINFDLNDIKLTKKQRTYFERYLELQSYTEVAKELNTTKQTVKDAVMLVQQRLRKKYLTVK